MQANGSILAIREGKKTSKRSRRTTQSQNNEPTQLHTVLHTNLDTSVGTSSEVPSSDVVYNKAAKKNSSEKNSSESIVSLQPLEEIEESMPIETTDEVLTADLPQAGFNDSERSFKEELMEEGEDQSQSTDDESEHDDVSQGAIRKLSDTNFFESCQVDVPYQNQQQIPLYQVPIDFKFKMGKMEEQLLSDYEYNSARRSLPKAQRNNLTKKTPKIFYLKTFDRDEYEKVRKRMRKKIPKGDIKCTSKTEFKKQLIFYPECFILVPVSSKRQQLMADEFDNALFYEIIQHKKFPEEIDFDRSFLDQTFEPNKDQSWFKIDESQNFHPETGK